MSLRAHMHQRSSRYAINRNMPLTIAARVNHSATPVIEVYRFDHSVLEQVHCPNKLSVLLPTLTLLGTKTAETSSLT